jgi:RES domain-containing protein
LKFAGTLFRAHDPKWSFKPISGEGAATHGGRFNPKGTPALYLASTPVGAIRETSHGFPHRIDPLVLCSYEVDCDNIVDLRTAKDRTGQRVADSDLDCAWMLLASDGKNPPSWRLAHDLSAAGSAGILVPSFAVGANSDEFNLVLWTWGPDLPHRVEVHDPSGRLPKSQLSWD